MPTARRGPVIYDRLGIQEVINTQSWVTGLGSSLMHRGVRCDGEGRQPLRRNRSTTRDRRHGMPMIVDESAGASHADNVARFTREDSDMVTHTSGGGNEDEINMAMVNVRQGEEAIIARLRLEILAPKV
ncbi:MAG: hypothetical protein WD208_05325 [Dehalococcoidia bacterium]